MTTGPSPADDPDRLAALIADEVRGNPAVARLDGGGLAGTIATHLPGGRVEGVRVTEIGAPVEVGVVLRLTGDLPEVTDDLRAAVRALAGDVPVHIRVTDVQVDDYTTVSTMDTPDTSDTSDTVAPAGQAAGTDPPAAAGPAATAPAEPGTTPA